MSLPPNPQPGYGPGNYPQRAPDAPRKPGTPVWAWFLIGCGGLCGLGIMVIAAVLFPIFAQAREKGNQARCLNQLGHIVQGIYMYSEDYDSRYPLANSWQTGLKPYVVKVNALPSGAKLPDPFLCPATKAVHASYAFNAVLSGRDTSMASAQERVVVLFESDKDAENASGGKELMVPRPRHAGLNNVFLTSGDLRSVPPGESLNFTPKSAKK